MGVCEKNPSKNTELHANYMEKVDFLGIASYLYTYLI